MGKKYGAAKAMNVAVVGSFNAPANITKKNISASDTFNAGREYKNQEGYRLPSLEEIYHIPSAIKREWGRMSKAEKIVYGTIFASTVIGLGIAADYKHNEGKTVKSVGDYSKSAGKKISAGAAGFFGDFFKENQPPAAIDNPIVNATVKATPQVGGTPQPTATSQPSYDYYDKECGCGIKYIEPSIKDNVTKMLMTMKEVTPNRYYEFFNSSKPYVPEKIVRSTHNYNFVGGNGEVIGLHNSTEQLGGSNDLKNRLLGIAYLYAEMRGGKIDKTGELENMTQGLSPDEAHYKAEMFQNEGVTSYGLEAGVLTKEQADAHLRQISDELKSGEYDKKYN